MCPFPTAPTWGGDLHIRLLGAARAEIDPSWWHWEEVERPFWRLFLAEAPGVVFRLGDRTQPLPAGRLCFVPPMPPSTYWTEAPIEIVFAHFDVIGLPKLVMDEVFSTPIILDERPDVESAFRSVQNRDWFVTPEFSGGVRCQGRRVHRSWSLDRIDLGGPVGRSPFKDVAAGATAAGTSFH